MVDIWQVVAELARELHPQRIETVATKIAALNSVDEYSRVRSAFGPTTDRESVERLERTWHRHSFVTPRELAAALRGASATATLASSSGMSDLVWTGPSTGIIPVRHTEQVLCEVIDSARWRLFLVSFVAYDVQNVVAALRRAVATHPELQLDVLLESSSQHGGRVNRDSVRAMRDIVPSANVYVWSSEAKSSYSSRYKGAVHAKCVVADGAMAFITSANLTAAAMDSNMELGVLVRGGDLPDSLDRHLDALITTGVVEPA